LQTILFIILPVCGRCGSNIDTGRPVALALDLHGGWNALYRGGDKLLPVRVSVPCVGGLWINRAAVQIDILLTVLVQFEMLIKANKDSSLSDHGR
jgi:hypothetical protein